MTCPICNNGKLYTAETIPGKAWCSIEDGEIVYEGETEVEWDWSESDKRDGEVLLFCDNPECDLHAMYPGSGYTVKQILDLTTPMLSPADFAGDP